MQHARPNRLRRAVAYAALAALLGVVTLVLSQCMMVGDNVTGVSIDRSGRANCLQNCKDTRDMCRAQVFHDCSGDQACIDAGLAACQDAFNACKNTCHKQGAGSAG
jgi:hypothetical protein